MIIDLIKIIISNLVSYIFILLVVLVFFKKFKLLKLSLFIIILIVFFSPIPNLIVYKIEKIYTPGNIDDIKSDFDTILILSGFEKIEKSNRYNQLYLAGTNNRIIEGTRLYKRFKKKIIFSGSSAIDNHNVNGVIVAKNFFESFDVDKEDIVYDEYAKNTQDTFIFLSKKFQNEKHLIVTSALHMLRCKYLAEKNDLNYILYPVDYRANHKNIFNFTFSIRENLYLFHYGLREVFALVFYKFSNRI